MNIYYENPQFIKLPVELQNHICSYLPPHPIIKEIKEYNKNYYEDNFNGYVSFQYHIKMIYYDNCSMCDDVWEGCSYIHLANMVLHRKNTDKYKDLDFNELSDIIYNEWLETEDEW
jgi:hypothetical protein